MTSIIGRRRELERIEGAVRRGLSGDGTLLLLSGEAGIGKTLLSDHAAARATRGGAMVAWGRCWEAGGAPAYWPWIEVFRALGEDADPFFPSESGESPADARFRSFDLVVRKIMDAAKRRPLAVLLNGGAVMNPYSTDEIDELLFIDPERAFGIETLATSLQIFHGWSWAWFVRR